MPETASSFLKLREEAPADYDAIREVNRLVFGGEDEARLVDQLREDGEVIASLVAVDEEQVVGHILFSELPIETELRVLRGAALAPMAVRPGRQRSGIGSALVQRGLEVCGERGVEIVVVVGHPEYYPRFGFSAELATRLRAPLSGEAFMALELAPGALAGGVTGTVRYAKAFGL